MRREAARVIAADLLLLSLCIPPSALAFPHARSAQRAALDSAATARAVEIGRSSDSARAAFHDTYRFAVDDPVVRDIEVVTPFRRVVLLTEERVRLADVTWDARRAAHAVSPYRGSVDLILGLQFGPRNTYRTVPPYSVVIYERDDDGTARTVEPVTSTVTPKYVASQPAPPGTPILSATLRASFDARLITSRRPILAGVLLDGREVARVPIDLDRLK